MKLPERSPARFAAAQPLAPVLLAALASCGSGAHVPTWISLGEKLELDVPAERRSTLLGWNGRSVELVTENGGATLLVSLRREDWQPMAESDAWQTPVEVHLLRQQWLHSLQLTTPEGPIPRARLARLAKGEELEGFTFLRDALAVGGRTAPPEVSTLSCAVLSPGRPRERRVEQRGFTGSGVSVLPGTRASCTIDIPPASALRFWTSAAPILGPLASGDESLFRVRLDGEVLYEHRQRVGSPRSWHVVPLPAGGRASARLDLEVQGSLADALFLDPRLGPREVGRRTERPWPETRPDIVVLLADTFRADNLAAYGGDERVTPNLDALAEQSLCFLRAWSTAPWTLPSHASLFSGYYPHQVRTASRAHRLPQEVETVVERLTRAGYRTGAVTDGGFVSARFGIDQGFDYFSERSKDTKKLPEILEEARAFLDTDDGRPTFLFVHTYRAHWPYRVSDRTRAELGERLGIRGEATDLLEEMASEAREQGIPVGPDADLVGLSATPRVLELARELHAHYLGAVADLDREIADFLEHLTASGVLESGYLVFTSDHGEAFCEHAALFHGSDPFEEQMRVPLLIAGRGLARRRVEHPTSLVDLAPTLAEMAGLPADPGWPGRSLLSTSAQRPVFGFESSGPGDSLFVLEGPRKVLCLHDGREGGRVLGAYDLALDARELDDQAATDAAWPLELLERHRAAIDTMLLPLVEGEVAELDSDKAAELRALGY